MIKKIFLPCLCTVLLSLALFPVSVFSGDDSRYSVSSIQEEYPDAVCPTDSFGKPSERIDDKTCPLNKPISLMEAIRFSLQNNPDTQMAIFRIEQSKALIHKANAAFYPMMSLYTEYTQGDAPSAYLFKTMDQRKFENGTDFNDPGWFENFESGIQGGINLLDGGKDVLNKKMAQTELTISQEDQRAVENSLVAMVIRAYYDYLAARDFIDIAEESESTVQSELDIMRVRLKAGGVLKSDVLSLEVRLAQAREDLVRSRNQLKMAMAALANLLGVSPDQEIKLKPHESQALAVPDDYESGVFQALNTRPELNKIREQLKQARMALDRVGGEYFPSVDLHGKYYHDDPNMHYSQDRENWVVAVMLNWNFFTGFSTRADKANATAQIKELLAGHRKTLLAVQLDVKNAYLSLSEAKARLEVAQKSTANAEESLGLVKRQFEGGSATITRYLEAELARNTARIRVTRAFYDREKALAEIGRAIGLLGEMFTQDPAGG